MILVEPVVQLGAGLRDERGFLTEREVAFVDLVVGRGNVTRNNHGLLGPRLSGAA